MAFLWTGPEKARAEYVLHPMQALLLRGATKRHSKGLAWEFCPLAASLGVRVCASFAIGFEVTLRKKIICKQIGVLG